MHYFLNPQSIFNIGHVSCAFKKKLICYFFLFRQNVILNSSLTVFEFVQSSCVIMVTIVIGLCSRYDAVMSEPFVLQHESRTITPEVLLFSLHLKNRFGLEFVLES